MTDRQIDMNYAAELRRMAENLALFDTNQVLETLSPEAIRVLLHELQVHQIELALQNEELRRAQEALEVARARYFELYNLAPVAYVTLNDHGIVLEANLTFATLLEMPRRGLAGQPLSHMIAPADQDAYYLHYRKLLTTGEPQSFEARLARPAAPLWVQIAMTVARDEASGEKLCRATLSDISARKQAEGDLMAERASLARRVEERTAELSQTNEDLASALRSRDQFLAMMSHELNTPLTTILGLSEILQEQLYGPLNAEQCRAVNSVVQSGRHLFDLLNAVLDFARLEVGKLELHLEPTAIADVCETALNLVKETATRKNITLSFRIDDRQLIIQAAPLRLRQILVNLLGNAVKFTPDHGRVSLEVTSAQAELRLSVQDSGIGIRAEDMGQLFEPFTQIHSGLARPYEGTGLGLALVRRLARLHGGDVTVTSAGVPGQGSCFTVTLPLERR